MTGQVISFKGKKGILGGWNVNLAHPEGRRKSGQAIHRSSTYFHS